MWIQKEFSLLILTLVAALFVSCEALHPAYWTFESSEGCKVHECALYDKDACRRLGISNPCDRRAFCESPPNKVTSEWSGVGGRTREDEDMEEEDIEEEDITNGRPPIKISMHWLGIWRYCLDVHGINIKDHIRRWKWAYICTKFHNGMDNYKARTCCVATGRCDKKISQYHTGHPECEEEVTCLGRRHMEADCCDMNRPDLCSLVPCSPEDLKEDSQKYPFVCFVTDGCISPNTYGWCCEMYKVCNRTICEEEPTSENFFLDYNF